MARPAVLGIIAATAVAALIVQLAFPDAFRGETLGEIFVESPEIYTRERLVNDRYQQDFWLEKQLERLDAANANEMVTGVVTRRRSGEVGMRLGGTSPESGAAGDGAGSPADSPEDPAADDATARPLPFGLDLRVRSGIRDIIRQDILENQLDDRHDLSGNSIYVLKFDTTVIPGRHTRRSALIRVTLDIPRSAALTEIDANGLPGYVQAYFAPDAVDAEKRDAIAEREKVFDRWTRGLEDRLIRYGTDYKAAFNADSLPIEHYTEFLVYAFSSLPKFQNSEIVQRYDEAVAQQLLNPDRTRITQLVSAMCRDSRAAAPTQVKPIGPTQVEEPVGSSDTPGQAAAGAGSETPAPAPPPGPEGAGDPGVAEQVAAPPSPAQSDPPTDEGDQSGSAGQSASIGPAGETRCFRELVERFAVRKALQGVLAGRDDDVGESRFQNQAENVQQIVLAPGNYAQYMTLNYEIGEPGSSKSLATMQPNIDVIPTQDSVFLLSAGCATDADLQALGMSAKLIDQVSIRSDQSGALVVVPVGQKQDGADQQGFVDKAETFGLVKLVDVASEIGGTAELGGLNYRVTPALLTAIAKAGRLYSMPFMAAGSTQADAGGAGETPECRAYNAIIPSGFFNFLEAIGRTDIFSYAVLPKQETQAYYHDASVAMAAILAGQYGSEGHSAQASARMLESIQEATSRSTVVGFGSSGATASSGTQLRGGLAAQPSTEDMVFGWVVTPNSVDPGPGGGPRFSEPTQRSMSAMVSVPAWLNGLDIKIETGWLGENAEAEITRSYPLRIPVPSDFESIDVVLKGDGGDRRPSILDTAMANYTLRPCDPASILIPGFRLWRSTRVTLGAQRADRITVLPNMEGIIASFDEVNAPQVTAAVVDPSAEAAAEASLLNFLAPVLPGKAPEPIAKAVANEAVAVPLRVWTSEGTDVATDAVRIVTKGDAALCQLQNARLERAKAEIGVAPPASGAPDALPETVEALPQESTEE